MLEALHRSRAWHTGLLGAALLAYLFAVHLAESRARLAVLRPQAPLIAAGLGLLALAAGAAALPPAPGRPPTCWRCWRPWPRSPSPAWPPGVTAGRGPFPGREPRGPQRPTA